MYLTRKFRWEDNTEYGGGGWMPTWICDADAFQSVGHDVLEHLCKDEPGASEGELMALGVYYCIRSEQGLGNNYMPAYKMLGNTIQDIMNDSFNTNDGHWRELSDPGITRYTVKMGELEDEFNEAYWYGRHSFNTDDHDERSAPDRRQFLRDAFPRRWAVGWMLRGYRRALHRYNQGGFWNFGKLVDRIDKASSKAAARVEEHEENVTLEVRVDLRTADAKLTVSYPWGESFSLQA